MRTCNPARCHSCPAGLRFHWCSCRAYAHRDKPHADLLRPESFHHYFTEFAEAGAPVPENRTGRRVALVYAEYSMDRCPGQGPRGDLLFPLVLLSEAHPRTPDGYIISEFLDNVPWAGKFNAIDRAAEDHLKEARWLRDRHYAEQYAVSGSRLMVNPRVIALLRPMRSFPYISRVATKD